MRFVNNHYTSDIRTLPAQRADAHWISDSGSLCGVFFLGLDWFPLVWCSCAFGTVGFTPKIVCFFDWRGVGWSRFLSPNFECCTFCFSLKWQKTCLHYRLIRRFKKTHRLSPFFELQLARFLLVSFFILSWAGTVEFSFKLSSTRKNEKISFKKGFVTNSWI